MEEQIRFACQEIEFYQSLFTKEMLSCEGKTEKDLLNSRSAAHILSQILSIASQTLEKLSSLTPLPAINDVSEFYSALKTTKLAFIPEDPWILRTKLHELHRERLQSQLESEFSGEEAHGKYLDLLTFHAICLQGQSSSSETAPIGYLEFLQSFDQPAFLDSQSPSFLQDLEAYLCNFISRTMPLFGLEDWRRDLVAEFKENPLYCAVCDRTFAKQTVFEAHLGGKRHLKASQEEKPSSPKDAQLLKFLISNYMNSLLNPIRQATIANVQRKACLTAREREAELLEQEQDDDDDDQKNHSSNANQSSSLIYNPLKLPLDWDGKPIPYWLWRLHGLGTEFPCEICAGYRYSGRKAFDRHFQEWRHLHGLRCIGAIGGPLQPAAGSKAFYGVTSISDALKLAEQLRIAQRTQTFRPETMEEYEDEEGNVFSRKTFEDLRKQGIL